RARPLRDARRIPPAIRSWNVARLPSRRIRPTRSLELPRLGTGAGGGRLTDTIKRASSRKPKQEMPTNKDNADQTADGQAALRRELLRSMLLQRRFEERC